VVRRTGRSRLRPKKGVIEQLYTNPPEDSIVVCLDEMGPEAAKSFPGQEAVPTTPQAGEDGSVPAGRAKQEIDYGRRGKGYIFGAFRPATGEALTHPYGSRSAANWVDFLEKVEAWVPAEVDRVYAIVDNLQAHRATDVLRFSLGHLRWEFVFRPKYAAYLNLFEPWWKVLRSQALKGGGLRVGKRCMRPWSKRRPTGTGIAIPSCGDDGATGREGCQALPQFPA
jgi:hypothetical protein